MMNYIEKVGNIKVYTEHHTDNSITVYLYNGADLVASDTYFNAREENAISDLFSKVFDTFTEEYLWLCVSNLELIEDGLYRAGDDYFKRIDNTRYYKHFNHKPMM